jgi:hypothetical protein
MSQASLEISEISSALESLPSPLQRALHAMDLNPELELEKYRRYKNGELLSQDLTLLPNEAPGPEQLDQPEPSRPLIDTTSEVEEDDDDDYEMIPPSQPFAVLEDRAGELVLSTPVREDESLDLSLLVPGEITPTSSEYRPASQKLWRSLGQPEPAPVTAETVPKWKLPVAIGSTLVALGAVGGMTYVNTHPTLLKAVPLVAQITAAPAPAAIPPGQAMTGPDLALGEFSQLNLANLSGITLPGAVTATAPVVSTGVIDPAMPTPAAVPTPAATVAIAPTTAPSAISPSVTVASPSPASSAPSRPSLANSLVKKLLPANIQQVEVPRTANPAPAATTPQTTAAAQPKPYSPSNPPTPRQQ